MGNALSSCSEVCDGGKNGRDAIDTVCMSCKERFGPTRRAYVCSSCKGGFCDSCGIVRPEGPPTCSSCISRQCNVPPSAVTKNLPMGVSPPKLNGGADPVVAPTIVVHARRPQRTVRHRKVCILGHTSVGKSAIVSRFVDDKFNTYHNPTVSSLVTKSTTVDGDVYNVGILDTAGQDEYAVFKPQWSIGTHGYVLVYSINDAASFEALHTIRTHLLDCHAPDVPIVLCGNKCDTVEGEVQVSEAEGRDLAAKWKSAFVLCSAKTGESVPEVFGALLKRIAVT